MFRAPRYRGSRSDRGDRSDRSDRGDRYENRRSPSPYRERRRYSRSRSHSPRKYNYY